MPARAIITIGLFTVFSYTVSVVKDTRVSCPALAGGRGVALVWCLEKSSAFVY